MRRHAIIALLNGSALLAATEAEPAKIVSDQLEAVKPALSKAFADYSRKVTDENNRLIAALQKAMEKSTKAGKLDEAIALKEALEQARSGELLKAYLEPSTESLLGGNAEAVGSMAAITVSVGNPTALLAANTAIYDNRDYLISAVAKELQGLTFIQRSFKEPASCTITVTRGGLLYVAVGVPDDGLGFDKLGFIKTEFTIRSTTGELAVVKKTVKAGESITLAPSATTSSFPIWKAK